MNTRFFPFFFFFLVLNTVLSAQDLAAYTIAQLDSLCTRLPLADQLPYRKALLEKVGQQVGTNDTAYAKRLYQLAEVYNQLESFETALDYYQQAAAIQQTKIAEHPDYARTLVQLADCYLQKQQELDEAERLLRQAMDIRKKLYGEKHVQYAEAVDILSSVYRYKGDYEKSELFIRQVLSLYQETVGEQSTEYARALVRLATLQGETGRVQEALPNHQKALAILKAVSGENSDLYALELNSMGVTYSQMGMLAESERCYQASMRIYKEKYGELHKDYARALYNMAFFYALQGKLAESEPYFLRSLAIRKEVIGESHPEYIAGLNNLATVYAMIGKFAPISALFQENIRLNTGLTVSAQPSEAWRDSLLHADYHSMDRSIYALGVLYEVLGTEKKAGHQQACAIIADLVLGLLERSKNGHLAEADKQRVLNQTAHWVELSLYALDPQKDIEKAFAIAEQNKSVLLLDASRTERAYTFGDLPDALIAQEKALQRKYSSLNARLQEKRSPAEKDQLRQELVAVTVEMDALTQQIRAQYPKYAQLKFDATKLAIADVQAVLNEKTALIEYVVGDSVTYIFYVDKRQARMEKVAVSVDSLTRQVARLHQALSDYELISKKPEQAYEQYSSTAHWFYETLLAALLEKAEGIEHLMIIPDNTLAYLPFETFLRRPATTPGNYSQLDYLIKDYRLSYNYSASLWKQNLEAKRPSNNGRMLGIAADYETDLPAAQTRRLPKEAQLRGALSPLPAARKEVESLAEHFAGTFVWDQRSTERFFKENAQEYGIIHLAMHGLLDRNAPILSALAFTEDGDSTENNFLQAHEISKLSLNADLVVLSACETGFGKFEKGNGTASLARAFMYAGVPALVVSLWEVNDQSTAVLMQSFYQQLAAGTDKAEALRQAKLQYLQQAKGIAAHPAYWSAFVQMGDSRAISMAGKGGWWIWLLSGALVALVVGGVWWKRRAG